MFNDNIHLLNPGATSANVTVSLPGATSQTVTVAAGRVPLSPSPRAASAAR